MFCKLCIVGIFAQVIFDFDVEKYAAINMNMNAVRLITNEWLNELIDLPNLAFTGRKMF